MMLETTIEDISLECADITAALELRHIIIHCDAGFVVRWPNAETMAKYLCRWTNECDSN